MVAVLVGFMGAGKTTVGHIVAERLGQPFVDSDVLIEQRLGRDIREIFSTDGEAYFRQLEHVTVTDLVRGPEAVIALGGGAIEDPRTRAVLRDARVVYLRVSYDEAMARVRGDRYRPMLDRPGLDEVYKRRLPIYEDLSVVTVDTDGRRPEAIALEVLAELTRLPSTPPGSSSVFVTPVGGSYYAHLGPGLADHVDTLLPPVPEVERGLVIEASEDAGVAARVAERLAAVGIPTHRVAMPDTQASKTFRAAEHLANVLADHAIHRDDLVIAVGGEAICDLAGFVAATFNRGMRLCLIPTTLVAQADSAVGGKNALNLDRGRNLVGTIHQPVVVISDIEVACRNAGRGFKAGLAEIAKHALISTSDLLGHLQAHLQPLVSRDLRAVQAAATRSIEIKADIVSRDEREQGDRVYLNYGHTFAHAIELVRGVTADDQGESVALGMMAAAHLAFRQGRIPSAVVDRHRELIAGLGLPVRGEFRLQDMLQAWLRDKKYRHGIRFVVLNQLGRPESGVTADEATLARVLGDLAGREPA
ncbi:MAG TPA: bifunctional shikimate kinase/3-dehydroquinate synthase [Streptosporangiaceae bacterium]|jgi:shikimate kinase/3-dehydroquinate synthase|nr:bifunctional shikimate kinase/3-dehydroquinate synthase [Streptosporangiaceae bacterium]